MRKGVAHFSALALPSRPALPCYPPRFSNHLVALYTHSLLNFILFHPLLLVPYREQVGAVDEMCMCLGLSRHLPPPSPICRSSRSADTCPYISIYLCRWCFGSSFRGTSLSFFARYLFLFPILFCIVSFSSPPFPSSGFMTTIFCLFLSSVSSCLFSLHRWARACAGAHAPPLALPPPPPFLVSFYFLCAPFVLCLRVCVCVWRASAKPNSNSDKQNTKYVRWRSGRIIIQREKKQ